MQPAIAEKKDARALVLVNALHAWAQQDLMPVASNTELFRFSVNDKRLAIPDCEAFIIDPMMRIDTKAIPGSFSVLAQCAEANWERRIRGRRNAESVEQRGDSAELAIVRVFLPKHAIKKGEKIYLADLLSEQSLKHRTPQNAITEINGEQRYAARDLMPGRMLVATDLVIAQRVVVLSKAIPARSPLGTSTLTIEKRAIDVPFDAIRSIEGLSLLAANRLLHPGEILRKRDLTKAKLIKRGQKVSVESIGTRFRIASELIALEDGYMGEQIKLRNPGSNRQVSATVVGMGQAQSGNIQ